jgi:hypothetical protein
MQIGAALTQAPGKLQAAGYQRNNAQTDVGKDRPSACCIREALLHERVVFWAEK